MVQQIDIDPNTNKALPFGPITKERMVKFKSTRTLLFAWVIIHASDGEDTTHREKVDFL
jgi:hypothetical protein